MKVQEMCTDRKEGRGHEAGRARLALIRCHKYESGLNSFKLKSTGMYILKLYQDIGGGILNCT